jgi:hypothetical protein
MRKLRPVSVIGLVTFIIFITDLSIGQTVTQNDLKALQTSTNPSNTHLGRSLSEQAQSALGTSVYRSIANDDSRAQVPGMTPSDIARHAIDSQRKYDQGFLILKGNDLLVRGSIGAGFLLAPATGGTSLVVSAIGAGSTYALGKVESSYQEAAQTSVRRNLKTELSKYETKFGKSAYDQLTSITDPRAFRQRLDSQLGNIFGSDLESLPPSEQDIVNHFYEQQIADVMKAGFHQLDSVQQLQQTEITRNRKDIKGLALTFAKFADSTSAQLDAIVDTQKGFESSLQKLNQRIGNTEQGVAFMQNIMFSNLKPADQLNALKAGVFPSMPEAQRKDLEEKISVVAKRQALTDQVSQYINGAAELANIARHLGVDPSIVNTVNTAVQIGTQAMNAFTAFSSGNVISGISSISNLFGVGGPDIATERHQEIMNMLGKLYTKLDVIDEKIEELHRGQQLILQAQQTILENIDKLSQQVQQNQEQLLTEIYSLHNDVLVNRQIVVDQASLHYAQCRDLVINSSDGSVIIDTGKGHYPSVAQFQRLYTDRFSKLKKCTDQLDDTRGQNLDFQSVFWMTSYNNSTASNITPFINDVYLPTWTLLQNTALNADRKTVAQRVSSLLAPMGDVSSLDQKLSIVVASTPPRFKKAELADLMKTPLAPDVVMLHDAAIANIHFYYTLLDAENHPRSIGDLYKANNIRRTGFEQLLEALSLTDVAIGQQSLVSGDSLLPVIEESIDRYGTSQNSAEQKEFKTIADLLKRDSVLASNAVTYILRDKITRKCNFLSYDFALSLTEPSALSACTDDHWKFHFSDHEEKDGDRLRTPKGWSVDIGGALYVLPDATELMDGRLRYTDYLYKLVSWRERLLEELNTYEIYESVPDADRQVINAILLKEFVAPNSEPVI